MEGFNKIDIFDTKGIEYLFVIGYLIFLIVFWNLSKRQKLAKQVKETFNSISNTLLRIPQGIFYNKTHTWTHLEASGNAKVGLDDFIQHVTGKVILTNLKKNGDEIKKGDLIAEVEQNGKKLRIYSPISGQVITTNKVLDQNPGVLNSDPYYEGWIYKIKPNNWIAETSSYYLGEDALNWSRKELDRFKEFVVCEPMKKFSSEPALAVLQDGGEIKENILADLPGEVWEDFQKEFLNV